MKIKIICIIFLFFSQMSWGGIFGPKESVVIFDGKKTSATYHIENTSKDKPWLVQAWVENTRGDIVDDLKIVPNIFRVEPSSVFSARIIKQDSLPEDHETLLWISSHSLPGGIIGKDEITDSDVLKSRIKLAYRFKTPLIYRPAALSSVPADPQELQWIDDGNNKLKVYNPTNRVIYLKSVMISNKKYQGKGVSFLIVPKKHALLDVTVSSGMKLKFGVVNDFGAIKEYDGVVK
ncbi:molecular chaperone [Escherichia coli]